MIVDTSFVLDVIDGVDAAVRKELELEAAGVPLVIPSMTVLELYMGGLRTIQAIAQRVFDGLSLTQQPPSRSAPPLPPP